LEAERTLDKVKTYNKKSKVWQRQEQFFWPRVLQFSVGAWRLYSKPTHPPHIQGFEATSTCTSPKTKHAGSQIQKTNQSNTRASRHMCHLTKRTDYLDLLPAAGCLQFCVQNWIHITSDSRGPCR
jgi:hypothetical protein